MRYRTLLTGRTMGALAFGLILLCTRAVNAQEMVTLTDMTGATVRLTTFGVHLEEGKGDLSHREYLNIPARLYGQPIYTDPTGIPIRLANGVFQFVAFDKISEYQGDGKTATIILVGGGRVVGSPLSECTFNGEGALGKVSLPAREVRTLKFNPERAKLYLDGQERETCRKWSYVCSERGWPGQYTAKALLTLVSGDEVRLQSLLFLYEFTQVDCNDNYIPCKPYSSTHWHAEAGMPVKYGALELELDFTKMQSMELTAPAKPATTPASFDITLLSGEKITATLNLRKESKAIGLLGTTEYGYAQVPLGRIKSITFMNGR